MVTRYPIARSLGSEFPAICDHCLKSQDLEILWAIFAFFGKTTPYGKILKILFRNYFIWRHRLTLLYSKFQMSRNLSDRKLLKSCVIYRTGKKNSPASETVATAPIVPRICHGQPPSTHSECSRFHPNRFIFNGVIVERSNTVFPVEYFINRPKRLGYRHSSWKYWAKLPFSVVTVVSSVLFHTASGLLPTVNCWNRACRYCSCCIQRIYFGLL